MSWLGRILTFLVFIGAVIWAYFTVNVYVTRTNWKVRADAFEQAKKESEANREREMRDNQANREALVRMYAAEKSRGDELEKALDELKAAGRKVDDSYKEIEQKLRETDVEARKRDARIKTIQDELADTRKRNTFLEDDRVKLVLQKEAADREKLRSDNEAKLARAIADENAKKVETLTARVTELLQTGGGGGVATVLRTVDKVPAPLPENIRGTVMRDMVDNFVQISIGIDAGLEPGSKLDVYRETNGGKYLGTLVVTKTLFPKEAVAEFRPARPVPVAQLRPDELPRKGDTVGHVSAGTGTR
jgi:hypothetical protein